MSARWIIPVIFLMESCYSYCEKHVAPLKFKGTIKQKYLSSYKDQPMIVVQAGKELIEFGPNDRDFYDYVVVGDSLIKKSGSYYFRIKRDSLFLRDFYVECVY